MLGLYKKHKAPRKLNGLIRKVGEGMNKSKNVLVRLFEKQKDFLNHVDVLGRDAPHRWNSAFNLLENF